jgi:hypothetical protein
MLARTRIPKKRCPQCGWDAEGKPADESNGRPTQQPMKRVPPPTKYRYYCENCGQDWVE